MNQHHKNNLKSETPQDSPEKQKVETTPEVSPNSNNLSDLLNPERLKISQNFADTVGVKKLLLTIPTDRPHRQTFIRVHPDPNYRLDTLTLELKEDRQTYLVDPSLASEIPGEVVPATIFTAITRQKVLFLWPVRLPHSDGKSNPWWDSARQAAQLAMTQWVRVASNKDLGAYDVSAATGDLADPEWPGESFHELLVIAFKDRFIRDMEHPVVQKLRGAL